MAAITLTQQESLPDALGNDRFEFLLGTIPGAGSNANMTLQVMNSSYPGFGNEVWDNAQNTHVRRFRGRRTYPRTITVVYGETVDMNATVNLRKWNEFIVGTVSGNSQGYRSQYSINADLIMYDVVGNEADDVTFWYFFVNDIPDIAVSGENGPSIHQITGTFAYDYTTSSLVTPT